MSPVYVNGWGIVSPAGWGLEPMRAALAHGKPIPEQPVSRPGFTRPLFMREVPAPARPLSFMAHSRLRRSSPLAQYGCSAGLEALAMAGRGQDSLPERLGVIVCLLSGSVRYTYRFYEETLNDPPTASPVLFPETVFNAVASHLATILNKAPLTCTFWGDPATFLQGVALAADWLLERRVEGCLVIGAEETNWLLADVLRKFNRASVLAGGAGALYLTLAAPKPAAVQLNLITDAEQFTSCRSRSEAALAMRQSLPAGAADELLCDSAETGSPADRAEERAWRNWPGHRLSPRFVLGEGLMAAGAWQCVAACDVLARGKFRAANVSIVGPNQQAIGARFVTVSS